MTIAMPRQSGADIIRMPKHLRMEWVDVMALDLRVSAIELRIACVVGCHVGNKSGLTYVSRETIAAVSGVTTKTVVRSIAKLESLGYLVVQRRQVGNRQDGSPVFGGRGTANEYLPAIDSVAIAATDRGARLASRVQEFWDRVAAEKRDTGVPLQVGKRDTAVPVSVTERGTFEAGKRDTGVPPTLASPSVKNSTGTLASAAANHLGPSGGRLRKRLGDGVFAAWFRDVSVASVADGDLILNAASAYRRSKVAEFEEQILAAWRIDDPTVRRVIVRVSSERKP